jgi:uncharacterized membrane protein
MEIFQEYGLNFLARWGHILSGITWIGLLYFFNFVQVPSFAELSDGARSEALRKLTFRALWWFRWGAVLTLLWGLSIIAVQDMDTYWEGPGGTAILTGILFAVTMFANVWGVIWPNQKIVIANAETVASGGQANPDAAASAKKAGRASRCNTFMSFTMLFFMIFAAHGGGFFEAQIGSTILYWVIVLVLWLFVEGSALGYVGGLDSAFCKMAFDDHKKTIMYGFGMLFVIYVIGWEVILVNG